MKILCAGVPEHARHSALDALVGASLVWTDELSDRKSRHLLSALAVAERLQEGHKTASLCLIERLRSSLRQDEPGENWKDQLASLGPARFCEKFGGQRGVVNLRLAYSDPLGSTQAFGRDIPGKVLDQAPDTALQHWDDIWVPAGYQRPFSELASARYALDKRFRLFLDLAGFLALPRAKQIYELHLTVTWPEHLNLESFGALCSGLGIKAIEVDLPLGEFRNQVITASFHRGSRARVQNDIEKLTSVIEAAGYKVIRTKLESMLQNSLVPQLDEDCQGANDKYFEFHVKIDMADVSERGLKDACAEFGAHLSRTASNRLADGTQQRFATLRVYDHGRRAAEHLFNRFLHRLRTSGFHLSNILREYTVLDTNAELDAGWASLPISGYCSDACDYLKNGDCPFADEGWLTVEGGMCHDGEPAGTTLE